MRGAAVTLRTAATRGIVSEAAVEAATKLINELKPGEVQKQVCMDLLHSDIRSSKDARGDSRQGGVGSFGSLAEMQQNVLRSMKDLGFSVILNDTHKTQI